MFPQLRYEPLEVAHLQELASVLRHPAVYEHIEDAVPPLEAFMLGLQRAIAGPSDPTEKWLNVLVRDAEGAMVGRLEATLHHGLAEVAFLFAPQYWGRGLATTGLKWLQGELARSDGIVEFWATTVPSNTRSQRLLQRCGYVLSDPPASPLYSYDSGDLVFCKRGT